MSLIDKQPGLRGEHPAVEPDPCTSGCSVCTCTVTDSRICSSLPRSPTIVCTT
jgi:hypothetical protein